MNPPSSIFHSFFILFIYTSFCVQNLFAQDVTKKDSLLSLLQTHNSQLDDTTRINTLLALSSQYMNTVPDTALIYAEQALQLANTVNWQHGIGNAHSSVGHAYYMYGNFEQCLHHLEKALEIRKQSDDHKGISASLGNIGIVYNDQGDYPKALSYYFQALEMDSVLGNKKGIAIRLGNIGLVYWNQGDYPKALSYFFQALEMDSVMLEQAKRSGNPPLEERNKKNIAIWLGNIGNVYWNQGDYPKALSYYFQALEMDSLMGNKKGTAIVLGNIGGLYFEQSDYTKALSYYFQALEMDRVMGNKKGIARHLGNIGNVYNEQASAVEHPDSIAYRERLFSKALSYYFQALEMDSVMGNKKEIATKLGNIGSLYTTIKEYDKAEQYLQRSLAISDTIGALLATMTFEKSLSELYAQTNRWQSAYNHHLLHSNAKDSVFGEEKTKAIGRVEMKHELEMAELERERIEEVSRRQRQEAVARRNLLHYSLIFFVIAIILIGILYSKRLMAKLPEKILFIKVNKAKAGFFLIFIFVFILFETLLLFADPYITTYTNGAPAFILLINAFLAMLMFPLHSIIETSLAKKVGNQQLAIGNGRSATSNTAGTIIGLVALVMFNSFTLNEKPDTTQQFNNLTIQQFNNLTIQQFNKADSLLNTLSKPGIHDTERVNILNNLFLEYEFTDKEKASEYVTKALKLSERINYKKGVAKTYIRLGYFAEDTGNYAQALIHYEQSLNISKKSDDKKAIAAAFGNIGNVYWNQGDYPKALSYYFQALEMDSLMGNKKGTAIVLGNIGGLYFEQSDYTKALSYYFQALEMDSVMGNKRGIAIKLGNIGNVYKEQGDYPKALSYYFRSLEMDSVMGNRKGIAIHLGNIGIVYADQGDYPNALSYYFRSLEMNSVLGNKNDIAIDLGNIGALYTKIKEYDKAEQYLLRSLAISDSIGILHHTLSVEKSISELYAQTNRWEKAYNHHILYSNAKDTVFGEEKTKAIGRVEMKHEIEMAEYVRKAKEEEERRQEAVAVGRRNLLQYSAIFIGFFALLGIIMLLSRLLMPVWFVEFISFVPFLILFEFILVFTDPYLEVFTGGAPLFRLLFNGIFAGLLYPLQQFSEARMKRLFYRQKREKVMGI